MFYTPCTFLHFVVFRDKLFKVELYLIIFQLFIIILIKCNNLYFCCLMYELNLFILIYISHCFTF